MFSIVHTNSLAAPESTFAPSTSFTVLSLFARDQQSHAKCPFFPHTKHLVGRPSLLCLSLCLYLSCCLCLCHFAFTFAQVVKFPSGLFPFHVISEVIRNPNFVRVQIRLDDSSQFVAVTLELLRVHQKVVSEFSWCFAQHHTNFTVSSNFDVASFS